MGTADHLIPADNYPIYVPQININHIKRMEIEMKKEIRKTVEGPENTQHTLTRPNENLYPKLSILSKPLKNFSRRFLFFILFGFGFRNLFSDAFVKIFKLLRGPDFTLELRSLGFGCKAN